MIDQASQFLSLFSTSVNADLDNLDARMTEVQASAGLNVFPLSDAMLERSLALRDEIVDPELAPFDEAILAAVLVRATELGTSDPVVFCTLDRDLSPVNRRKEPRPYLQRVYAAIGLEVRTSFDLSGVGAERGR